MQIADSIAFRRPGKNARRIVANYTSADNLPDIILVYGTEDFRRINKTTKDWTSRCKYSSLEITLQFLDFNAQGITVETASYDKNGKRIVTPTQDVRTSAPMAVVDSQLNVNVAWTSDLELGVLVFALNKESGGNDLGPIKETSAKGAKSSYTLVDDSKERGTFDYAVYANFADTTVYGKLCGRIEGVEV